MTLREELIEAGAKAIHPPSWGSPFESGCLCVENSGTVLDAFLDLLTERADKVKDHKGNIVAIQIDLAVLRNPGSE